MEAAAGDPARVRTARDRASSGLRVSPLAVRSAIESALSGPAVGLRLEFDRDKVVLNGEVSSSAARATIEMAARSAPGVCRIENRLRVTRAAGRA
jgi:osmotically-inducible protein OsmY